MLLEVAWRVADRVRARLQWSIATSLFGARYTLEFPERQLTQQRRLLPQKVGLLITPAFTLIAQLKIEIPQYTGQNEPHLIVGEITSNTVPGPDAEGLQDRSAVGVKWRRWVIYSGG